MKECSIVMFHIEAMNLNTFRDKNYFEKSLFPGVQFNENLKRFSFGVLQLL